LFLSFLFYIICFCAGFKKIKHFLYQFKKIMVLTRSINNDISIGFLMLTGLLLIIVGGVTASAFDGSTATKDDDAKSLYDACVFFLDFGVGILAVNILHLILNIISQFSKPIKNDRMYLSLSGGLFILAI